MPAAGQELKFVTRLVKNPYKWQFAIDYGNESGPWCAFVINRKLFAFGYLPSKKKKAGKKTNVITMTTAKPAPLKQVSDDTTK
jgi:hypothetical protein